MVVDGYSDSGNFFLTCSIVDSIEITTIPPPSPLTFLGTMECDGNPVTGDTTGTGSTLSGDYGYAAGPDVAYGLTLSEPSAIELSTCESSFDTWLHLYTADGQLLGEELSSCDDCGECGVGGNPSPTILSSDNGSLPSELPAGELVDLVAIYIGVDRARNALRANYPFSIHPR